MRALTFDEALRVRNMRAVELWALANDVQGVSGMLVTPDGLREMALDIVCDALVTLRAENERLMRERDEAVDTGAAVAVELHMREADVERLTAEREGEK